MKNLLSMIFFISLNLMGDVFELNVTGSMEESIIGAPIYIRAEIKNVSSRVQKVVGRFTYDYILERTDGKVVKKKPEEQYKVVPCENVDVREVGVGEKEEKVVDLGMIYDIEEVGSYILKVKVSSRCDRGKGRDGKIEEDVWHGELKKFIKIEIKEPEGVDREAYEYFKGNVPLSGERAKEVLEKFPTSTYAGWVLKDTYSGALLSFKNVKDYITELKLSFEEKKKKWINERGGRATDKGWIDPLPIAKDYIEKAEKFIKHHPNFGRADVIYFKLFLAYLVTNEWEKAYEAGKKVEGDFPYEWAIYESNFKEVMKELKEQGLVKDKN